MTLRSSADNDEFLPDYGLILIRDHAEPGRFDGPDDAVEGLDGLEEEDAGGYSFGTLALAGVAWLRARATGDRFHRVRLEAHDGAPADDAAAWAQVMETPYFCRSGGVGLTGVTGSDGGAVVPLSIGLHRVRVACRPADDEGDVWRFQFWPDPTMQPPQWIKRTPAGAGLPPGDLAGDVMSALLWTGFAPATVAGLAWRVHADVAATSAAIAHELDRHLRLDAGDLDQPQRPVVLTVQPRPTLPPAAVVEPPPQAPPGPPWEPTPAAPEPPPEAPGLYWIATGGPPRMVTYHPPLGSPPRAGYVTDTGHLMVWRNGELTPLTRVPAGMATETAHGTLVTGSTGTVIVRADGTVDDLGVDSTFGRLDEHGRHYAVVDWHLGRHEWYRLHLIDLSDGSRRTMPWDEAEPLTVNAVHNGVVHFNTTMLWRPGQDPEPAPYAVSSIDPLSGTALCFDPREGPVVIGPDGTRRPFTASPEARLAPGGDRLYEVGHSPAGVSLFDAVTSRKLQTYWLPPRSRTSPAGPQPPMWEDRTHLLVYVERGAEEIGAPVVRLDVVSGEFEGVPLAGQADYARLVQPLLGPDSGRALAL